MMVVIKGSCLLDDRSHGSGEMSLSLIFVSHSHGQRTFRTSTALL
jgi:hypothetical protein